MWQRTRVNGAVTYYKVIERRPAWKLSRNTDGVLIKYRETVILRPDGVLRLWWLRDDS